jgi:uroporphyrinogen decarboxylase
MRVAPMTSRFLDAARRRPTDVRPVWFMRQAGRYMKSYRDIRAKHSMLEICKRPDLAAAVTIQPVEALDVDAAIIFADLLLPVEPMGLKLSYPQKEGPQIHNPVISSEDVDALSTSNTDDLGYVGEAIQQTVRALAGRVPVIGFCAAPFTLASYMIEGGSSRNYIEAKKMMYASGAGDAAWPMLMEKLVEVLTGFARQQVEAGADVIQIFDSWAGALSVEDYREFCLAPTTELVRRVREMGVPVIYFGVDTASLLPAMRETGADVIGLDWRTPLAEGWKAVGPGCAVQGNLDPIALFAPEEVLRARVAEVLRQAGGRPGHIFNLGHGIVPGTPVENVIRVVEWVKELGRA